MLHFFHVPLFSCTFFILHHFHAALFCVVIFPCCTFFRVALFLCIALFHDALLHVAIFSFCILLLLHSSHVAIFPVALCSCCSISRGVPGPPQTSKMESFATIIKKVVKYCCKALHIRCSRGCWQHLYYFHVALFSCRTFSMLHFFHIALFPCCTFSMLHSFHVALF